jgi:cytidyltransferase-like protein
MSADIFTSKIELAKHLRQIRKTVYMTSGGFDPMHVGHLRCIQETVKKARADGGVVVVIVNDDAFLMRKKGYSFMPHEERMEIIGGIEGVDFVTGWDDGSQTVTGAIEILRPHYFTKGGDRDASANVPEFDLCEKINCKVLFNVGGGKIQSSSTLVNSAKEHLTTAIDALDTLYPDVGEPEDFVPWQCDDARDDARKARGYLEDIVDGCTNDYGVCNE